jgi:hypothetical protein
MKWHLRQFSLNIFLSPANSRSTNGSIFINQSIIRCYIVSILTASLYNKLENNVFIANYCHYFYPLKINFMCYSEVLGQRWKTKPPIFLYQGYDNSLPG